MKRRFIFAALLIAALALSSCDMLINNIFPGSAEKPDPGQALTPPGAPPGSLVPLGSIAVSASGDDVTGDGLATPYKTIARAMQDAVVQTQPVTIYLLSDLSDVTESQALISGANTSGTVFTLHDGRIIANVREITIASLMTVSGAPFALRGNKQNTKRVVRVSGNNAKFRFENVTIEDGKAEFGGGILISNITAPLATSAQLTLGAGVTIQGNEATGYGGGIYIDGAAVATPNLIVEGISPITIGGTTAATKNTANNGGGGIYTNSALTLTNVTITGNTLGQGGVGGAGIFSAGTIVASPGPTTPSSLTLINSTVTNNTGAGWGGGIYVEGVASLTGSTITGNGTSDGNGGGIYAKQRLSIDACTIANNTANAAIAGDFVRGLGGGIYIAPTGTMSTQSLDIKNSTIGNPLPSTVLSTGNKAANYGGGVYFAGGTNSSFTLSDSVITCNSASSGGGVYAAAGSEFSMTQTFGGSTEISNNSLAASAPVVAAVTDGKGAGVYTAGVFNMQRGTIGANTIVNAANGKGYGGGVYTASTADFTMSAGATISGNTINASAALNVSSFGGGVYSVGKFTLMGGTISGNTINATTTPANGFSGVGGGIYVAPASTLTMTSGTINGNIVRLGTNVNGGGGGVFIAASGSFFMFDATDTGTDSQIYGNSAIAQGTPLGEAYGGGVYAVGRFQISGGTIAGATTTPNPNTYTSASTGGGGAAVFIQAATPIVRDDELWIPHGFFDWNA